MKFKLFLGPLMLPALSFAGPAADGRTSSVPAKQKSQFNTQVYEQTSEESSFEAVVKVVREVQGEEQVFFEGKPGFYSVAPGASQALLVQSQKKKTPVKVQVNPTARQVLKVESL